MGTATVRRGLALGGTALALVLGACGGGGGVQSTPTPVTPTPVPTPTPTPAPAPTPTPTPPATGYDTAEYRATVGAVSMNALAAYSRAATGAGIAVAVIDSGIDLQSEEFGSRISPASADVGGNGTIDDVGGHGTAVAFTLAGRRNGAGTHGVAFDATLIVLRADRPGTCTATSTDDTESSCRFSTIAITQGVDAARAAGARVINISLGGSDMPASLQAAIGRATAAGIVVVIAAGNDGTADPDAFTAVANSAIARGQIIIAGSVGASDAISSFSDRAGSSAAHYLAAVGERVRAPDASNTVYLWSGTSFAAPQISAAVALLAQAFPTLTGAQIVDLLQRTARDAGATGVDAIYGNGILDLTRAFQPVGATTVAGTGARVSLVGDNATLSAPMGDAEQGPLGAVILDGYRRAFAIDLAGSIAHTAPSRALGGALIAHGRSVALAQGDTAVAMTLAPIGRDAATLDRLTLTGDQASVARAIAATVIRRFGPHLSAGFGMAQGSAALVDQLAGQPDPGFLVATAPGFEGPGFGGAAQASGAVRRQLGALGITAAVEQGRIVTRGDALLAGTDPSTRSGFARATMALDRRWGPVSLRLAGSRLDERDSVLGARFAAALGSARATSWFADAGARVDAGAWTIGATWRRGWTMATARDGLAGGGRLRTAAFAVDVGHGGFGLRLAQPLRVASGGLDLALPTGWDDLAAATTGWTTQHLNLAPAGRELDVEARYALALGPGALRTNLFWRRDPGNWASVAPDYGLALRYAFGF